MKYIIQEIFHTNKNSPLEFSSFTMITFVEDFSLHTELFHFENRQIFYKCNLSFFRTDSYDYRVLGNGEGDIEARLRTFKLAFRTKLNNWWISNASKLTRINA